MTKIDANAEVATCSHPRLRFYSRISLEELISVLPIWAALHGKTLNQKKKKRKRKTRNALPSRMLREKNVLGTMLHGVRFLAQRLL